MKGHQSVHTYIVRRSNSGILSFGVYRLSLFVLKHVLACVHVYAWAGSSRICCKEQIFRDLEGFQDYNMITAESYGSNMMEIEIQISCCLREKRPNAGVWRALAELDFSIILCLLGIYLCFMCICVIRWISRNRNMDVTTANTAVSLSKIIQ